MGLSLLCAAVALTVVAVVERLHGRGDAAGAAAARAGRGLSLQTWAKEGTTTQRAHLAEQGGGEGILETPRVFLLEFLSVLVS